MTAESKPAPRRADLLALWGGIAFSFIFTAIIALAGWRLEAIPKWPDSGPNWYFWRLMDATTAARVSAWGLYLLHQLAAWGLIFYAQTRVKKYTPGLHPINVIALAGNALFILLHFAQTHLWYGGLAEDVSIWSSQVSVIILLVWVLLMENSRRGLFFGKKAPISKQIVGWARKYHGYVFAWAAVYTFWYHPMESTWGHLFGFFYMFLLMLQGSLIFTRAHLNKFWTVTLEVMVAGHGTMVAVLQGNNLWPMFFFGFMGIFIITQMHGLGWPRWVKIVSYLLYAAMAIVIYNGQWVRLNEIIRIPFIEYLSVFVLTGLIGGGLWLARRVRGRGTGISQPELRTPAA
jgi:hypothetical protein